jgi:hypothetical protein
MLKGESFAEMKAQVSDHVNHIEVSLDAINHDPMLPMPVLS